jgi:ketosteroid isomerase-like protein
MRRALAAAALATALLAGCGDSEPSAEAQVRQTLGEFGRATAAKDYQALCDRVFAPALVRKLGQVGLPCEVAMQRSFEDVENPRLTIGKVTVAGDEKSATAEVRTSATGQKSSPDNVQLMPVEGGWRVSSLG